MAFIAYILLVAVVFSGVVAVLESKWFQTKYTAWLAKQRKQQLRNGNRYIR